MAAQVEARPIVVGRHREREFERLLASLPVAAYTCDRTGLITFFNDAAVELWGRAPELNSPVDRFCGSFKLFNADGTPIRHDECWMAVALRDGCAYNGREILIERPDGSRAAVLAHANPIRDEQGRVTGAVNILVDITDRKSGERAMALLAAIVTSSDDAIISKTLDGTILSWNAGAERIFGWTAEEAIGKSIKLILPEERWPEEDRILAAIRRGERIEHYETIRKTKDGRLLDISLTTSPVRDANGNVVAASKVARDISARKLAHAALVAVKDELATQLADMRRLHEMSVRLATTLELRPTLFEILRTAAAIHEADLGVLALVRPGETRLSIGASIGVDGRFIEELEGQPLQRTLTGVTFIEHRRIVVEDVEHADERLRALLVPALRAGARAAHCTPLRTRRGVVIGVLSLYFRAPRKPTERDIHLIDLCARQAVDFIENAQLYTDLREADRAKNEFLATLAHELRNPLAPIRNAAHILQRQVTSPEQSWALEVIERQMRQMTRLVDDLLDVARISGNKLELRKELVDLSDVLRIAVETSRPLIDAAGHRFEIDLPEERIALCIDVTRVAQAVSNLLNNASKFTPRGGHITLSARREDDSVVIRVRDDGIGIPPEMLPRVFELFTQISRALDRAQGGLGIGLNLVKRLVEMHGGTVSAHSEGPGHGTEFGIRLPIAHAPAHAGDSTRDEAAAVPSGGARVLVVDDNRDSAASLATLLRLDGYEVRTAFNGTDGVECARAFRPEIVLLDVGMPGMDGYAVAGVLRKDADTRQAMLIAVTGWGHEEDRERARAAGFDQHLVKPVDPKVLSQLVARLVAENRA